jgi:alkanesulfonate monooxygenase SsuD/methylene tetrahydromethanopterin reductase-like flavin-dependent oxidoreductase (luciferase family)
LPSWIPVAGAMAALTKRIRFGTNLSDAIQPPTAPRRRSSSTR